MDEYIIINSLNTKQSWKVSLSNISKITLLSAVYEATPFEELFMSPDFSYAHMFLEGRHNAFLEMQNEQLIHLFKYADYLDYRDMQDYIGNILASRLDDMSMEKLGDFQENFNSIE